FEYTDFPPLMSIVPQHHPDPWLPTALGHLGIPSDEQHSSATKAALAALHKALDAGRPVYCEVDRSRFAWHGEEPSSYAEPYGVVVAGGQDGVLLIEDVADAPHAIAEADFGAAWAAHKK